MRNEMDLERWMAATKTAPFARVKIERSFETELQGGAVLGCTRRWTRTARRASSTST